MQKNGNARGDCSQNKRTKKDVEGGNKQMKMHDVKQPDGVELDIANAFDALGQNQRGDAEHAMLRVQKANVGGVLNPVVEHTGDLIHRMSHMVSWGKQYNAGQEYILEKCRKVLGLLTHGYGFQREHEENLKNNAQYQGLSYEEHKKIVDSTLDDYAAEHAKLPAYNSPQILAKQASIAVGKQDWSNAVDLLQQLYLMSQSDDWWSEATNVTRDSSGNLKAQ